MTDSQGHMTDSHNDNSIVISSILCREVIISMHVRTPNSHLNIVPCLSLGASQFSADRVNAFVTHADGPCNELIGTVPCAA